MTFRSILTAPLRRTCVLTTCAALLACATLTGAGKRPIRKVSVDPTARQVELFAAMEQGLINVNMILHSSEGGNIFVENKTDQPLTIQFPKAVVGIEASCSAA